MRACCCTDPGAPHFPSLRRQNEVLHTALLRIASGEAESRNAPVWIAQAALKRLDEMKSSPTENGETRDDAPSGIRTRASSPTENPPEQGK